MRAIRHKDTSPELLIRRALHARGFRFRLHDKQLPGKPDLVLPRYRAVVFVNGCFWHGHSCSLFKLPATRTDFWLSKIGGNVDRDNAARAALLAQNWRVATVWECALRGRHRPPRDDVINGLAEWIVSGSMVTAEFGTDVDKASYPRIPTGRNSR